MAVSLCRVVSVFFIIIIFSVLLIPVVRQHPLESGVVKEHMSEYVSMPSQAGMLTSENVFRNNTDLDYASMRWNIQMSQDEKRKTQQLAPIVRQYQPVIASML